MAERTCIICRSKADKEKLVRLVAAGSGLAVDRRQSLPGRGAYIHLDPACVSRLAQVARLERALRLPERTLDVELLKELAGALLREVNDDVGVADSKRPPSKGKLRL